MSSARNKVRAFFKKNVGKIVTTKQIAKVAGISEYARRIRELRDDEGMKILSHNDRHDLKPGQYILESLQRAPRFSHKIDKTTRARILERNGLTCCMCGATAGDVDPYNPGRTIRLHVDHINPDGPTIDDNLRTVCNNCNEGKSNLASPPTPNALIVIRQIRRLPRDQQRRIFGMLKSRLGV